MYGLFDKQVMKKKRTAAKVLPKPYQGNVADMPLGTNPSTTEDIDQTNVWAEAAPIPNELCFSNIAIHNVVSLKPQENDAHTYDDSSGDSKHKDFRCNVCLGKIIGFLYRCCSCPDFDMCSSCEARGVHPLHYVLRVPGFCSSTEVRDVIAAVRLALTRPKTNKSFIENNKNRKNTNKPIENNNNRHSIDPLGLDNGRTISPSPPITFFDPIEQKFDPFNLLTPKKRKMKLPKELKIEYSPKKQYTSPPPLAPISSPPLVPNAPDFIRIPLEQYKNPPPLTPLSGTPLVPNVSDFKRIPLALKKLPAHMLPPPNAVIRKIKIAPPQEPPKRKKSVKLKLIGKKNLPGVVQSTMYHSGESAIPNSCVLRPLASPRASNYTLVVALDAVRKKAAVRLRPLPKNIKTGVRVIIPCHYDNPFY